MQNAGLDYRVLNWHLQSTPAHRQPVPKNGDGLLSFSFGNAKLPKWVASVSLPSGHSCPGALECKSRRNLTTGKIEDGKHCKFRCFSATQEVAFNTTWNQRLRNWHLIRSLNSNEMVDLISASLPSRYAYIRLHVGGDFFNQSYFDAWVEVAQRTPTVLFYGYTKSLTFWVRRLSNIPENLVLTASRGGKHDLLIEQCGLREAVVVYHPDEAKALGLEIDHDDSHAMRRGGNFALLIHGVQPKGSDASTAIKRLNAENVHYGYDRNARKQHT